MSGFESQSLYLSDLSRQLLELAQIKRLFKNKENWDSARQLDVTSFRGSYDEKFLEYISMDFDAIVEEIARKERLSILTHESIALITSQADLKLPIENLSLDDPSIQKTICNQASASVFSKSKEYPKGFGYLPTLAHFDPTHYEEHRSLTSRLVPSTVDIDSAPLLQIYGQSIAFCAFGETEAGGISQQFSKYADRNIYKGLKANGQKQFKVKGLTDGIASGDSYEDFHIEVGNLICAILEIKGAEGSLLGAVSQAAVSSTNVAMSLLSSGISKEDCVVPVIGSNGIGIIFGAMIVLDISFPTYIPISKLLDLSCPQERKIASAYLIKASSHCLEIYKAISNNEQSIRKKDMKMLLNTGSYFVKKYTPEVFARGLGLFDDNINNFSVGLHHMLEVFNKLYAYDAARQVVEFPLSVRTADKASASSHQIIYRDLRKIGYKCGAPNRIEEPLLFETYKDALFSAVHSIHKAGVIHCDLYISNVMWKSSLLAPSIQDDSTSGPSTNYVVDIKIVDWDASHCLEEGQFAPMVLKALQDYFQEHITFGVALDLRYLHVLNKKVCEEDKKYWHMLSSDIKEDLDLGYRKLLLQSY